METRATARVLHNAWHVKVEEMLQMGWRVETTHTRH